MRGRGAALAAFLLLAGAACQAPGLASQTTPRAPATPAVDRRLAAADARFYAGDYDGAETDYQALVKLGTAGAASHYAVFLAYQSRFKEAVAQAQAGVEQKADSPALARLTRALDWSNDINAAVAAGARAVSTAPVDPIAHIYYGEALADAARYADSQRELKIAEKAGSTDAYTRAEVYREWANFYRGRSDAQAELNNIQLALKAQPRFPERTLELARYYYVQQKPDQARTAIGTAVKGTPSYGLLVAAGDSSLFAGDADTAAAQYVAALQVNPGGAAAAVGAAVLLLAANRDFKTAHDLLLAALRKDPANATVYEFLFYLDKLVLKTDPAADLNPVAATAPTGLAAARQSALDSVNAYRRQAGLSPLAADDALAEAAEAHAWYTMFNFGQPSQAGLGVHTEDPKQPGFTGATFITRDRAAGYPGNRAAEVINHVYTPSAAVAVWVDSVYHRFPILDRETTAIGYGDASIGVLSVAVMDIGIGAAARAAPVVFPPDGARDVPAAFVGHEIPDPAPSGTQYPVGYPLTLVAGSGSDFKVQTSRLLAPDGKEVPGFVLLPGQQVDAGEWSFLAKEPFKNGATYTAEVIGTLDGQPFSKRWSFTVTGG
ncbi:MAG: CAP domain-containing protein [Chloroflexota bacterium]